MKRTNSAQGMVCRKFELTKFCYYWGVYVCVRKKREKTKLLLLGMKKELLLDALKVNKRIWTMLCWQIWSFRPKQKMHLIKLTREEVEN